MAHETQYWSFRYILGTAYSGKTEASEISPGSSSIPISSSSIGIFKNSDRAIDGFGVRIAADSTMLRIVNLFIALSFGVHLEQFEQRIGLT